MGYINTKKNRSNLYQKLNKMDVISKMRFLLERHRFKIRADGKFDCTPMDSATAWNTPWVHQHSGGPQECGLWHNLFFDGYGRTMIPSYCLDCWKVVVFIPTVESLFNLYEVQHDLCHPCKCGLELRFTDERCYGGYFYNRGKEAGIECYEKVKKAVKEGVGKDIKVILKCSCSEYELALGPPAEYVVSEKQKAIEHAWNTWVARINSKHVQPDYLVAFTMIKWIHHAAHIGDLTYRVFTGGNPITKTLKTYHQELEGEKENG